MTWSNVFIHVLTCKHNFLLASEPPRAPSLISPSVCSLQRARLHLGHHLRHLYQAVRRLHPHRLHPHRHLHLVAVLLHLHPHLAKLAFHHHLPLPPAEGLLHLHRPPGVDPRLLRRSSGARAGPHPLLHCLLSNCLMDWRPRKPTSLKPRWRGLIGPRYSNQSSLAPIRSYSHCWCDSVMKIVLFYVKYYAGLIQWHVKMLRPGFRGFLE